MRSPLAALVLAWPSLLPAQNSEDYLDSLLLPAVTAKLQSENPGEASWGGTLAGKYRLSQLGGELSRALARWNTSDDSAARVVRLHLLDGMIRAKVDAPGGLLSVSLRDRLTRDAAMVVLGRNPRANMLELEALATDPAAPANEPRFAAAQLLVVNRMPSRKLAKLLLARVHPTFSVAVGGESSGQRFRRGGRVNAARPTVLETEPGFPPLVRLRVTGMALRGAHEVIAPSFLSLTPRYIRREEGVAYKAWELKRSGLQSHLSKSQSRQLVAAMGRGEIKDVELEIEWTDAATLKRVVERRYREFRRELEEIVSRLRKVGWLQDDDLPGYGIPIKFEFEDQRGEGDKSPLPEFELEEKR